MKWFLWANAVTVSLRVGGLKERVFADLAHIAVGALLGAAVVTGRWVPWVAFGVACVVEVLCAVL